MPRLYLDSNVISYLHHPEQYVANEWHNDLSLIASYLDDPLNGAEVVYSAAHLMDVRKGFDNNEQLTRDKLNFISALTKQFCIVKDIDANTVRVELRDAVRFFSRDTDNFADFLQPGDRGINLLKIVEGSPRFEKYKKIPFNFPAFARALGPLPLPFSRTKNNPTLYAMMCDFAEYFNELSTNGHIIYRMIRQKIRADTGIDNGQLSQESPLASLDELLQKSETGRLIDRVMKDCFVADAKNRQDIVASLFMNLDLFGFKQDKLSSRHGYLSVTTDADHCYYASYCDLFVTMDGRTAAKAKAVYEYLNLDTKVADIPKLRTWMDKGII